MMYDFISALCFSMILLSAICLYFAFIIQISHEFNQNDPKDRQLRSFIIGITFICVWALFQSTSYLLGEKEWDIITRTEQYKVGLIGRGFGIMGLLKFFDTLSLSLSPINRILTIWGVGSLTLGYLFLKVLF